MKQPLFLFALCLLFSFSSKATETTVIVRAKAKDAKFIGSSIGGAKVVIRNSLTGEIMAQGITSGTTGNTKLIMQTPQERGKRISDEATAKFEAVLDIDAPVFATVEVYAPINKKQAMVSATTQLWILPGKDILGDGIVLEIPGFVVDILAPQTHEVISTTEGKENLQIKVNIVMMCGCPIENGGMWDAEHYEVQAVIKSDNKVLKEVPLTVQDKKSTFGGKISIPEKGNYEIIVSAYDAGSGNTGVDKTNIIIR